MTKDYPWYTLYQFAGNKPIRATDLDGLEENFIKAVFGSPASYVRLKQYLNFSFSYIVQRVENLTDIAKRFFTTVDYIASKNRIKDKNNIKEGQVLQFGEFGGGDDGGAGTDDTW